MKRHGKEPGGFLINHKTQGQRKRRTRNQHWDLLAKAESPPLHCLAGSCGFLSPGSCRYAAKPYSGLISPAEQLGAAHTSPTCSSALPALGESQQICRISATCTPRLSSKSSAHSKRGVMKKLSHPTAKVTRRHIPNTTLPARRQGTGRGFQLHSNLRPKLMHLTNT